ncbi:hemocyte protein-glutamine gamma-glutamyltransferase-like [Watersipora subatra]|uniref:hemocyte protein-glutamine gamma-glutamyltransferase-like n=1 Tax=Watersipora subatra TaxID=2589382 RepID=UPI00355C2607
MSSKYYYGYDHTPDKFYHSSAMRSYYNVRYGHNSSSYPWQHHHQPFFPPVSKSDITHIPITFKDSSIGSSTCDDIPIKHFDGQDKKLARQLSSCQLTGRKNVKFGQGHHSHFHVKAPPSSVFPSTKCPHGPVPPPLLKIACIDLCIETNAVCHHTDKYEVVQDGYLDDITKQYCSAKLVVRRGQEFGVFVETNRKYTEDDHIRVIAKFGTEPLSSKGTYNEMITGVDALSDWSVRVGCVSTNRVELFITSPASCAVGKWKFQFDTIAFDNCGDVVSLMSDSVNAECYLLFNSWCREDPVYMEKEEWRQEYVLNDTGKIYTGNWKQIFGRPWNFGQFESCVLEAALFLLNKRTHLCDTFRGNPIAVSRKLSALVNSSDDYGVLTGRWDENYAGGVSPTSWIGSVAILQKYMERGGKPVEYGQCWVFAGVLNSICRALGIPTRCVSNFESAHDTDGSLTIDVHWKGMQPMPELDTDSVWNFHVWNECWMTRPDLQEGYGGWQVVDSTPQETSNGVYCAGPAPVAAIKQGDVGVAHDTPFIFAEVNADRVHWIKRKNGSVVHILERDVIGKNISTKAIGSSRDFTLDHCNPDRVDITNEYKYPEGTYRERMSVWRAAKLSTKPVIYRNSEAAEDVKFAAKDIDDMLVGSSFTLGMIAHNKSSCEERTVNLMITLSSIYNTGVEKTRLKQETFQKRMAPYSKESFKLDVGYCDYEHEMLCRCYAMRVNYLAYVEETGQVFAFQDIFRLRTYIPELRPSKKRVRVGETFTVKAKFQNPLAKQLSNCEFNFEAAGNLKPVKISSQQGYYGSAKIDVNAGATVEVECDITAKRVGDCVIITSFECKELGDMQAQCSVVIDK